MVVVPLYVLAPVKISVAAPFLTRLSDPVVPDPEPSYSEKASVIVPAKVFELVCVTVKVTAPSVRLAPVLRFPFAITALPEPTEDKSETTALRPYRKNRALLPGAGLNVRIFPWLSALALPRYRDPRCISSGPAKV